MMYPKTATLKPPYQARESAWPPAPDAKEQVILEHYHLVKYTAYRLAARLPDHVSLEDLFNAGVIGLMDAIQKFDPNQGIPFETYAKIRIRGAMLDEIRSMDWVPRSLRQKSSELERVCNSLEQRLGRFPTDEEITRELGIDMDEYFKLLDSIKGISFIPEDLHDVIQENREARFLASENDALFQEVYRGELQQHLTEAIKSLTEKEQLVLSLYYFEELTMKEVGNVMGYTESRISQIHTKAVLKLRTRLARKLSPEDLPDHIDLNMPLQNGEKKRGRKPCKLALVEEV